MAYSWRKNLFIKFHEFVKKRIDTAEDYATQAKHFKSMGIYGFL